MIGAFFRFTCRFLVQEFITESAGGDLRCFVIRIGVIAAMKRQGPKGDFRSNLHRGGISAEMVKIRPESALPLRATKVLGMSKNSNIYERLMLYDQDSDH